MKKVRIKARVVVQPCIFRETCHGSCAWCQTHMYTEACVGMLQHQCECLRKNWVKAEAEKKNLQLQLEHNAEDGSKMYTLEEIAKAICNTHEECSEDCQGWLLCSKGNKGTLLWLREVMGLC